LAVVIVYFRKLLLDWESMKRIIVGFIPTGILGLTFYKIVKQYLLGNAWVVVSSLFLGGIAIIAFERWHNKRPVQETETDILTIDKMSYKQAALIGLAQAFAMIPGVSRSAATILGGMSTGLSRAAAVEFSFLLAVPTMAAATGLDILKSYKEFSSNDYTALAIGFSVSFVVALAVVYWLLRFVRNHDFTVFGWYRIVAAALFAIIVLY
jgi:undecaprenyl-diphosphatase